MIINSLFLEFSLLWCFFFRLMFFRCFLLLNIKQWNPFVPPGMRCIHKHFVRENCKKLFTALSSQPYYTRSLRSIMQFDAPCMVMHHLNVLLLNKLTVKHNSYVYSICDRHFARICCPMNDHYDYKFLLLFVPFSYADIIEKEKHLNDSISKVVVLCDSLNRIALFLHSTTCSMPLYFPFIDSF